MPNLGLTFAATSAQLRSNMAQRGTDLSPTETQHGEYCSIRSVIDGPKTWEIPVKTRVLRISDWAGHVPYFEAMWTSTWVEVLSCSVLEPSWVEVGATVQIWPNWCPLAEAHPKWRECCGRRMETVDLDDVVPIRSMCKLPQSCPDGHIGPFVASVAELPRLGTFRCGRISFGS